jgi:hypothetical protein
MRSIRWPVGGGPHPPALLLGELHDGVDPHPGFDLHGDGLAVEDGEKVDLAAARSKVGRRHPCPTASQECRGDALAEST